MERVATKTDLEVLSADDAEIRDTDIAFSCPFCGKSLVIDYRGAGLEVRCTECGKEVLVPIPGGMELADLDLDTNEVLSQLFATRRNYQKAEFQIRLLREKLVQMQETLGVMQNVIAEGLAQS
ncbi:MAG: hypothetical protein IKD42_01685 [Kiritimatiellae bacterium]|nr:hypothetical protein [Kiritimatiellia bacterium]